MFLNQIKFCFCVNDDDDDERHISLALYLFVLMCFLADERIWATTTIKIFLFLDSNNVFENKVSAALMCSHYSKAGLLHAVYFCTLCDSCFN